MSEIAKLVSRCIAEMLHSLFVEFFLRIVRLILFNTGCIFLFIFTLGYFPERDDVEADAAYIYWAGLLTLCSVFGVIVFLNNTISNGW
jgi:hypothetical protein